MATLKVIHDLFDESLTVFFGDPETQTHCQEVDGGLLHMAGDVVIGYQRRAYRPADGKPEITVETKVLDDRP